MSIELIKNLQNPACYDHPVNKFELLETHCSWILLTGSYAYKIKKPVDFGFLNYSTLEQRHFYCQEEIKLNRPLAPGIYLEVVSINGTNNKPIINGPGPIIEYAIKMRQFAQTELFTDLLARHKITVELIEELAVLIANFHQQAAIAPTDSPLGSAANVHAPVRENFIQILPLLTEEADRTNIAYLSQWSEQQFEQHYSLLQLRKQQGFIRDCHGDLHLRNIILHEQKPMLFDRIEFNDELRWTDPMADIAFLAMDLEDQRQTAYSYRLLSSYFAHTADYQALALLPYYQAYRAIVRAKVNLFGLLQPNLDAASQAAILAQYRQFINLAISYTRKPPARLFITHGLTGAGKSTIAKLLVDNYGALQLSSDISRKRYFGLTTQAKTHSPLNGGIYRPEVTEKIYEQLLLHADLILKAGYSVVIDASFLLRQQRAQARALAQQHRIPLVIVHCNPSHEQLEQWIQTRLNLNQDPSEADLKVLVLQQQMLEPLQQEEQAETLAIDTGTVDRAIFLQQIRTKAQLTPVAFSP